MNHWNKKFVIIGVAVFLCLSGLLYFVVVQRTESENWQSAESAQLGADFSQAFSGSLKEDSETENRVSGGEMTEAKQKVYICGAVMNPGVYEVLAGDRLDDLVKLCGGLCEDADLGNVNLAATLEDGEKIYIRSQGEAAQENQELEEAEAAGKDDGRVNINTAGREELMTLPGIGAAKAEAILSYREAAPFTSIEDIMKITGIKEGVFSKIKDFIKI